MASPPHRRSTFRPRRQFCGWTIPRGSRSLASSYLIVVAGSLLANGHPGPDPLCHFAPLTRESTGAVRFPRQGDLNYYIADGGSRSEAGAPRQRTCGAAGGALGRPDLARHVADRIRLINICEQLSENQCLLTSGCATVHDMVVVRGIPLGHRARCPAERPRETRRRRHKHGGNLCCWLRTHVTERHGELPKKADGFAHPHWLDELAVYPPGRSE